MAILKKDCNTAAHLSILVTVRDTVYNHIKAKADSAIICDLWDTLWDLVLLNGVASVSRGIDTMLETRPSGVV